MARGGNEKGRPLQHVYSKRKEAHLGDTRQNLRQEDITGGITALERPHRRGSERHSLKRPRQARGNLPSLRGVQPVPLLIHLAQVR